MFIRNLLFSLAIIPAIFAEPMSNLVTIDDGMTFDLENNISDDYVRLHLINPSYQTANSINLAITEWLGPDMVIVKDRGQILVQAPRASSARVAFISALLELDIQ